MNHVEFPLPLFFIVGEKKVSPQLLLTSCQLLASSKLVTGFGDKTRWVLRERVSGSEVVLRSQVGVGEHGVLLPHGAETFDGVDKFLIVHKL